MYLGWQFLLLLLYLVQDTYDFFQKYYLDDKYYIQLSTKERKEQYELDHVHPTATDSKQKEGEEQQQQQEEQQEKEQKQQSWWSDLPPALLPPPGIDKLYCIYGMY